MTTPILPEAARALMELMLKCETPYAAETLVEITKDLTRGRAIPGVFNTTIIFEHPEGLFYFPVSDWKSLLNKRSSGEFFRKFIGSVAQTGSPLLAVCIFSLVTARGKDEEKGRDGIFAVIETPEGNHLQIYVHEGEQITELPYSQQDAEKWQKDGIRLCNFLPRSVFARQETATIN